MSGAAPAARSSSPTASPPCSTTSRSTPTGSRASATTAATSSATWRRLWNTRCATRSSASALRSISGASSKPGRRAREPASVQHVIPARVQRHGRPLNGVGHRMIPAAGVDLQADLVGIFAAHAFEPHAGDGAPGDPPFHRRCEPDSHSVARVAGIARIPAGRLQRGVRREEVARVLAHFLPGEAALEPEAAILAAALHLEDRADREELLRAEVAAVTQGEVRSIRGIPRGFDRAAKPRDPAGARHCAMQESCVGAPFRVAVHAMPVEVGGGNDAEYRECLVAETAAEVGPLAHDAAPDHAAQRVDRSGIREKGVVYAAPIDAEAPGAPSRLEAKA